VERTRQRIFELFDDAARLADEINDRALATLALAATMLVGRPAPRAPKKSTRPPETSSRKAERKVSRSNRPANRRRSRADQ
jgi:hypothetical protein